MNDYITKPIDSTKLFETLAKWVKLQSPSVPAKSSPAGAADLSAFASLEPFMDVPAAMSRMMGKVDLLHQFLKSFLEPDPKPETTIRAAMLAGDRATAHLEAHSLKGIAATLEVPSITEAARVLEAALQKDPCTGWEEHLRVLELALTEFRTALTQMYAQQEKAPDDTAAVAGDDTLIQNLITELNEQLLRKRFSSKRTFEELKNLQGPSGLKETLTAMEAPMLRMNYLEAQRHLEVWMLEWQRSR